jgi:hypothetical protein
LQGTRDDCLFLCGTCHRESTCWEPTVFTVENPTYTHIRSKRAFGLELETSACPDYRSLREKTCFGAKFDCSVNGMEFYSPILYGDEGLAAVEAFCADAATLDFAVDSTCGLHLHLDMRDELAQAVKSVAYAYLRSDSVWRALVNTYRANDCGYCRRMQYTRQQLEDAHDMANFCDRWDRYALCNLNAYTKFGSFEIRLYQGSVDAKEICNWVKAHTRFVDWAKTQTLDEVEDAFHGSNNMKWESLKSIFGDIDLNRTYGRIRRERLGIPPVVREGASATV